MAETYFEPNYTERSEAKRTREVITNTDWNELWNLNSTQGDHSELWLDKIYKYLFGAQTEFPTTTTAIMAAIASDLANRVRVDVDQGLTSEQKARARANIEVGTGTGDMLESVFDPNDHHTDVFPKKGSITLSATDWDHVVDQRVATATTTIPSGTATVVSATFISKVSTDGTYVFTYDDANECWTYNSAEVDLEEYGITYTGTPEDTNTITVVLTTTYKREYTQTVTIAGTTALSKIDLQPSSTVIIQLANDGIFGLYIENNSGTLICHSVGAKPTTELTIQITHYEVTV